MLSEDFMKSAPCVEELEVRPHLPPFPLSSVCGAGRAPTSAPLALLQTLLKKGIPVFPVMFVPGGPNRLLKVPSQPPLPSSPP